MWLSGEIIVWYHQEISKSSSWLLAKKHIHDDLRQNEAANKKMIISITFSAAASFPKATFALLS